MWLVLSSLTFAGGRCGPTRCDDGEVCGNASCGICMLPGQAAIQPHCGWEPGQVGGVVPLFPQASGRPLVQWDLDTRWDVGRAGAHDLARWRAHFQAPLGGSAAASIVVDAGGASGQGQGARRERLEAGLLWSPPLGTPRAQGALHGGVVLDRALPVASSGWLGPLGRATDAASFQPRPWIGVSYLGVPRPAWWGVWSLSVQVDAGSRDGALDVGVFAAGSVAYTLWGNDPLGASLAATWRDQGGPAQFEAPFGVYVLPRRALQLGVEAGPVFVVDDRAGSWGLLAGVRLRAMVDPGRARALWREILDVGGGER